MTELRQRVVQRAHREIAEAQFQQAVIQMAQALVTTAQHEWLELLAAYIVETHVWRPSDWSEIEARLKGRAA